VPHTLGLCTSARSWLVFTVFVRLVPICCEAVLIIAAMQVHRLQSSDLTGILGAMSMACIARVPASSRPLLPTSWVAHTLAPTAAKAPVHVPELIRTLVVT
jgi:hypothetical protein